MASEHALCSCLVAALHKDTVLQVSISEYTLRKVKDSDAIAEKP